ncbi:MAG TPA: NB-ARC domain-containing protein [Jatrophihabitans sp.]|nr:NB-ARC domain-containing protein [Jatrophihabitans sp.]
MPNDQLRTAPFGQLLRSLRTRALLSQEQLAQRSGLGVRTIRDLEGGRVSYPHGKSIRLLAGALGLVGEARQVFELSSRAADLVPPDRERLTAVPSAPVDGRSMSAADHGAREAGTPRTNGHLAIARQPAWPASTEWAMPAHLPMDTPVFAGRAGEIAQLDGLLEQVDNGPTVVVAAIWGGPGVGKTTLAVHWAHRVGDHFPDGQLYVDLRGFDQNGPLTSSQVICSVLGVLGVPSEQVPADLHAQACLYRSLLHRRRVLVLLDNARDVEQVRPLLPGTPGCLVVVTSRQQLTGLIAVEGATPVPVDLLSKTEARELMARRLGTRRVLAESAAVDEIIDRCARLPLAMAVFASCAAAGPNLPLAVRAAELREANGALDASGGASSDVRSSFTLSYNALSADAARLFRLFGRSQNAVDLTPATAALLTRIPELQVRAAFGELCRAHLTVERRPGYFSTHRLLRAYAAELAETQTTRESAAAEAERKQNTGRTAAIEAPNLVVGKSGGLP